MTAFIIFLIILLALLGFPPIWPVVVIIVIWWLLRGWPTGKQMSQKERDRLGPNVHEEDQ